MGRQRHSPRHLILVGTALLALFVVVIRQITLWDQQHPQHRYTTNPTTPGYARQRWTHNYRSNRGRNTTGQISLVLTTRIADPEGFPRVPNLLESILKFFEPGMVHTLFIICPDSNAPYLANAAHAARRFALSARNVAFAVRIVADSELLTANVTTYRTLTPPQENAAGGRGTNYRIQMLLKLAVSRLIETEFYITLDSDVIVTRYTTYHDIVLRGAKSSRGIIQGESLTDGTSRHQGRWWESADRILKGGRCVKPPHLVIGVTPAVLATSISMGLLDHLEQSHNVPWDIALFQALRTEDWTEYTLYWTYGCLSGLNSKHHVTAPLKLYGYSGFEYLTTDWDARKEFRDSTHRVFSVLQSIAGTPPEVVNAAVAKFLS